MKMINPNDFLFHRERKVKVSVDIKKIKDAIDWSELKGILSTAEELTEMRVSSLQKAVEDFEKWLLEKAIDLKKQRLYVLNYTKYNIEKISLDYCYCVIGTNEAAEWQQQELLNGGTSSTIVEYNFDNLLNMSDNEFESMPDLGCKDLARRYREIMRVVQNDNKA